MQGAICCDPVGFCREILNSPWSKQREIFESVRDHKCTAVRSAHGVGKTAMAARCALWFLAAHPYSRVVTTAPTWSQVKEQLWREIHEEAIRTKSCHNWGPGRQVESALTISCGFRADVGGRPKSP
jgi:phage terminase large subunit